MHLVDIYITTPLIVEHYRKYNGSFDGLFKIMYPLYSGVYSLFTYKGVYCLGIIQNKVLYTIFWGSDSDKNTILEIYKNANKMKKMIGVDKVHIKFDVKNGFKSYRFLDKICEGKYVSYIL